MRAVGMASDLTFGAPPGILATKRKNVTTMATPIGAQVGDRLEAVRNPMVNLFFVTILYRDVDQGHERG